MKQRIKRNNRRKADFGIGAAISLLSALLGTAATVGTSAMAADQQRQIADKQSRQGFLSSNMSSSYADAANQSENMNYNRANEIETARTSVLPTLNTTSQFRCGGNKRMKKAGGSISANVKGLGRYI